MLTHEINGHRRTAAVGVLLLAALAGGFAWRSSAFGSGAAGPAQETTCTSACAAAGSGSVASSTASAASTTPASFPTDRRIVVYKLKTCGCCGSYADYLRRQGFEVEIKEVRDLDSIHGQYGVPDELASCHTSVVGGYAVEGHVPVEAIEKLLAEKPPLKGVALPAMPLGSPGMTGEKSGPFTITAFDEKGPGETFVTL